MASTIYTILAAHLDAQRSRDDITDTMGMHYPNRYQPMPSAYQNAQEALEWIAQRFPAKTQTIEEDMHAQDALLTLLRDPYHQHLDDYEYPRLQESIDTLRDYLKFDADPKDYEPRIPQTSIFQYRSPT